MLKTIFDWSKEIMTNKRPWSSFTNEEKNIFNGFMINKILSQNPDYIEIVNYAQIIPHDKNRVSAKMLLYLFVSVYLCQEVQAFCAKANRKN